ncbi:MAG TPA: hypothetical protein VGO84_05250, partial [Burkholderiales bacterium]|nr:hypothetical protein [Burkholderiales bacterium]
MDAEAFRLRRTSKKRENVMRIISAWILATALGALCAVPAGAQDSPTLKKIKDKKTIVLGVREAADPFS